MPPSEGDDWLVLEEEECRRRRPIDNEVAPFDLAGVGLVVGNVPEPLGREP